jgi:hypothetical protein
MAGSMMRRLASAWARMVKAFGAPKQKPFDPVRAADVLAREPDEAIVLRLRNRAAHVQQDAERGVAWPAFLVGRVALLDIEAARRIERLSGSGH